MDFCWDVISKNANVTLRVKKCLTDILLISFKFFAVLFLLLLAMHYYEHFILENLIAPHH